VQCWSATLALSTNEQYAAVQVAALKVAGCERIYRENGLWRSLGPT
jgi:hypothetical protein